MERMILCSLTQNAQLEEVKKLEAKKRTEEDAVAECAKTQEYLDQVEAFNKRWVEEWLPACEKAAKKGKYVCDILEGEGSGYGMGEKSVLLYKAFFKSKGLEFVECRDHWGRCDYFIRWSNDIID